MIQLTSQSLYKEYEHKILLPPPGDERLVFLFFSVSNNQKNRIMFLFKRAADFVGSKSCWSETAISVRTASVVGFIAHKETFVQHLFRIWSFLTAN